MGVSRRDAHHVSSTNDTRSRDDRYREGSNMGFAAWLLVGVLAAWIADAIPPDSGSTRARTLLVSVLGALLGGAFASVLGVGSASSFLTVGGWLGALGGAAVFLMIDSVVLAAHRQRPCPPSRPIDQR
jgi:uncharacterized membrane protein YeaQ/YmgE (transglycosylase-associated protein family)